MNVIKCSDKCVWDEFVAQSPQYNLFCTTEFLDAWALAYDLFIVGENDGGQLAAVVIKDEEGIPVNMPFMYQGLLLAPSIATATYHSRARKNLALVERLLAELVDEYGRISFSLHNTFNDLRGFLWFHYHEPEKKQFRVDLKYSAVLDLERVNDIDDVLAGARTVRRQEYRRCMRDGYYVESSDDFELLDRLHAMTFARQGLKRSSSEEFMAKNFAKTAVQKGFGRINVCRAPDGSPASASLFLFDKKTGYYLIGANDPSYRSMGTGSYVIFNQIQQCIELGLKSVDFVGANSPQRGDFKTSFNAALVPYMEVFWEAV